MAQEQSLHGGLRRAERHADANLASALGNGVRDHTVDSHDAEQQSHTRREAQHHQGEGRASHGPVVDFLYRAHAGDGQIRIHGPYGPAYFIQEARGTGPAAAYGERLAALGDQGLIPKIADHQGPIDDSGSLPVRTVVSLVAYYPDYLAPDALGVFANPLTERGGRLAPEFARHGFGN